MTDCPNGEMRDLLPDLLHDRLAPARRAEVEAHVASCDECREELELLGTIRGSLRRAPAVSVPAIVAALPTYRAPVRRSWGGWRAAAAITAIAVGGTSIAIARHETAPAPVTQVAAVVAAAPVTVDSPVVAPDTVPAAAQRVARVAPRRELPVAGAVGDLSDRELADLLKGLESLDAVPAASADAEATSLAPAAGVTTTRGTS